MPLSTLRRGPWKAGAMLAALAVMVSLTGAEAAPGTADEPTVGQARFDRAFRHGTVPVDGGKLHYVKGGSGPVLVLLHGWPQTWWTWRQVMPELAKTHTVIAFDLPGLGASSVPSNGYDKATTARRIHQAVETLGYGQVDLLAQDLGATVAYRYARDFPADVGRMAVLDMPLPGFGLEKALALGWPFQIAAIPGRFPEQLIDNDDVRPYIDELLKQGSLHPERIDKKAVYKAYAKPENRHAGYEYTRAFPADAAANQADVEGNRLKMPVLAALGLFGVDEGVTPSWKKVADDVREVTVPDTGHVLSEENPRFLTDCVVEFFGGPTTPGMPTGCKK